MPRSAFSAAFGSCLGLTNARVFASACTLGDIAPTRGDYYGVAVNRAARIMDAANGDQIAVSDAMSAFVDPSICAAVGRHELRGIGTEMIHLIRGEGLVGDDRPLRAEASQPVRRLPAAAARSVGRSETVERLIERLTTARFVTIVGTGGVGKTHVALEVGRRVQGAYRDGAVWISLAEATDGDDVVSAAAEAIGAREQPGLDLASSIVDYLAASEVLLLIDNGEHVARWAAPLIERLIECPGVTVLATSRAPFASFGEHVVALEPLDVEDASSLFVERAQARVPDFVATPDQAAAIRRIVVAVDGLPLGVELAAAWARVLPLEQIAERLEHSTDVADRRTVGLVDRQRTLHDTIDWSYRQLDAQAAELFTRLSVFPGDFSLDAVEAICVAPPIAVDVVPMLMTLVDSSMLRMHAGTTENRFSMLRPLRHFASRALEGDRSALPELETRHAEHYLAQARMLASSFATEREPDVWAALTSESANMRKAFVHLRGVDRIDDAVELVCSLGWPSATALRPDPFDWANELLEAGVPIDASARAALLGLRAIHKYFTVDEGSRADAESGLALDETDPHGFCRIALGAVWLKNQHEADESARWTTAWLSSLRDTTPLPSRLWANGMRAFHLCVHDPTSPETEDRVLEVERIAGEAKSPTAFAIAHWARGMYLVSTGAPLDDARSSWTTGRQIAHTMSETHLVSHLIIGLELHFVAEAGELVDAVDGCRDALRSALDQHYLAGASHLLGVTAIVLNRLGERELALTLLRVMEDHGHQPRANALDALGVESLVDPPPGSVRLSMQDAASKAIEVFSSSYEELTSRP